MLSSHTHTSTYAYIILCLLTSFYERQALESQNARYQLALKMCNVFKEYLTELGARIHSTASATQEEVLKYAYTYIHTHILNLLTLTMRDNTMRYCKGNGKNTAVGNSMPATTDTSRGGSPNLSIEAYDSTFVDSVLRLLKNVPKMV